MSSRLSDLQRSKRLATLALVVAALIWLILLFLVKLLPDYAWCLHILLLSAEAGVVGGLADWYAVTVLFRNPFGRLPIPAFLRNHTEILPRNQARIAKSMGRFIQENFLSPAIVRHSLQQMDISLAAGRWLAQTQNSQHIVSAVQQTLPKTLDFVGQQQLAEFIKQNSIEWLQNTPIHKTSSELLRAILDNDFHQDVLQLLLDQIQQWIVRNPSKVNALAEDILRELGVWKLAKGATFFGFDVQQRGIDALLHKVEAILTDRHHPLRAKLEQQAQRIMHELAQADSPSSQRLEQFKQHLLSSPTLLNFMTQAVVMLCDAMKQDLLQQQSGIAKHLQSAIQQFAESLQSNDDVRILLNQRLTELAIQLSEQYGDKVIDFVSQQIQSWDSREMIDKIENAVGKDLHMIRVNGVVVGAFIGLFLGIIRALIEWV